MKPSLPLALLPLLATLALHGLGLFVVEPMQVQARARYVVVSRADQLDLLGRLERGARRTTAREMARELRPIAPALAAELEACGADPEQCKRSKGRDLVWRKPVWIAAGLQLGLAAAAGLVLLVCGGLLTRRTWGRRKLALGLALAGTLLGLGGAARQVQGAVQTSEAAWREARRDQLITRARIALRLPPTRQLAELREVVDALGGPPALRRILTECSASGGCPRGSALLALGRLYGEAAPVLPPRAWLDRWLLWLGASLLLLVPVASRHARRP